MKSNPSNFEFTAKEITTAAGKIRVTEVHEKITEGFFAGSKEKMGEICEFLEVYQPEHGKKAGDIEYEVKSNFDWKKASSFDEALEALKYENR